MKTQTPSETLARKPRPVRAVVIGAAALVVIAGAAIGLPAALHAMTPTPKPTPVLVIAGPMECDGTVTGQGVCITTADQTAADTQVAQVEAEAAAKAKAAADALAAQHAAEQAAAEQAAKEAAARKPAASTGGGSGSATAGLPAGAVVPSIPGTTSPDTTKCASGSASDNAQGVAVCD